MVTVTKAAQRLAAELLQIDLTAECDKGALLTIAAVELRDLLHAVQRDAMREAVAVGADSVVDRLARRSFEVAPFGKPPVKG